MATESRNVMLTKSVSKYTRSQMYKRRASYKKHTATVTKKETPAATVTKTVGGDKNGASRTVPTVKAPKYYPAEDGEFKAIKSSRKVGRTPTPAKLRASITPGTVVILLAGRFRGKRVVCLKQLASGLLLVSGPFKINGVPMKRVNQAYVIATSAKVDLSAVALDAKLNDDYFKRPVEAKSKEFFAEATEKKVIDATKKADQKTVDAQLLTAIKKVPSLSNYLNASFTLSKGQAPHTLKF